MKHPWLRHCLASSRILIRAAGEARHLFTLLGRGLFAGCLLTAAAAHSLPAQESTPTLAKLRALPRLQKKIDFVNGKIRHTLKTGEWEEYDGAIYDPTRGYGWLTDGLDGRDRGPHATIVLADGSETSAHKLGRPELADWQGAHQESLPLVFRLDLPDGWYRVTCTSVDPGVALPLVDQRSFKCRAHDVVFAGARYGAPLVVGGKRLVEGSEVVEVTDGHLRIVVGDPAYAGWIWKHPGRWYEGWGRWLGHDQQYAVGFYQKVARRVDPGFHSLRLNSLQVEAVAPPSARGWLVFRDHFNRDDSPEVNSGLRAAQQWKLINLNRSFLSPIRADLYKTSIRLTGPVNGAGVIGLLAPLVTPATGLVRYKTRVSLFTGAGSRRSSGMQEAGILLLVDPSAQTEDAATFVGVSLDPSRPDAPGCLLYRVGNGEGGYRTNLEIPDAALPFQIREGEYEIVVEHDTARGALRAVRVNGIDVTQHFPLPARQQRLQQGLFGIRSMLASAPGVRLQQFYWFYHVERS